MRRVLFKRFLQPVKDDFPLYVLSMVIVVTGVLGGVVLVVVPALLIDVWDVTLLGLAAGTLFFTLMGLWFSLPEMDWMPSNVPLGLTPYLMAALSLGVQGCSQVVMTIAATRAVVLDEFNIGALFVVMLIAMLPIGLTREAFRKLSDDLPSRPWAIFAWLAPCVLLDTLMWFRPDLLRLPIA